MTSRTREDGILSRYHGGAGQVPSVINRDLESRHRRSTKAIAARRQEHIPDRSTAFLTAGSTIEYVAKALDLRQDLRIITTSLRVANLLYPRRDFDVMIPGGSLRPQNSGVTGPSAPGIPARFSSRLSGDEPWRDRSGRH